MRAFYSTCLLAALANCSAPLEAHRGTPVTVTRFAGGAAAYFIYSQVQQPERLVIRDQASWNTAWASLFPPFAPIPLPPQVDFTKEMVVFAALGSRSTGGYSISVDSAFTTGSSVKIFIGTTSPGPHCIVTQAFSQPVDIAKLPRLDALVQFQDVPTILNCQ